MIRHRFRDANVIQRAKHARVSACCGESPYTSAPHLSSVTCASQSEVQSSQMVGSKDSVEPSDPLRRVLQKPTTCSLMPPLE